VVAALAGLAAWKGGKVVDKVVDLRFGAVLPAADFPAPRDAAEARHQDFEYLDRLTTVDRSFSPEAAARFHAIVADLKSRAGTLDRAQAFLGVAEAVALADNAHTNVDPEDWRRQLDGSPVRFEWFDEGLHVVRAAAPHDELRGARVLEIDGIAPEALLREAARFFGGPPEHVRLSSPLLMESPEALHALHAEAPADRLVLRVALLRGGDRTVELPAIPTGRGHDLDWRELRDTRSGLPLGLRGAGHSVYAEKLGDGVLYLHLWKIRDEPGRSLASAIREALGPKDAPAWRRILLDVRRDGGGDVPDVYAAIRDMPERLAPDGRIVVVQDATTFSAAIIVSALVKHFAGARATIVGEKPGDRLAFWAEGNAIKLPNSEMRVTTSTAFHDWARGCRELRCYWPNFYDGVAVGNVDPDVSAPRRFEDFARGLDTALDRARTL
jgi:hypothetical protein